ncbi:uncharacterized protein BO95DRAFT_460360 [Aspergillus brunneoviolaceus CBS 621.78]|uniref:Uncharacterized protein n=1 Tax=Aspergillus brunneoviolaceus CBS 621.78 TaxID=1450534 RepID=A0ACD1GJ19_9EURO|nr:hypothetical protein BO95DRAFT_460360 [Aspergillus brunneoviolaceus CBS 621.78]RAH49334.1 hypothetical protein BO95DRAFT_460360 [Aspergillus brunneoviolaceus CBS 621.78]
MAALVCFVAYEGYDVSANPVISLDLFRTRSLLAGYIGNITHGLMLSCGLYYLPFCFEPVKGYTSIISGVALFAIIFTVVPNAMTLGVALGGTIFSNRVRAHTLFDSVLEAIRTHPTTMTKIHLDPVALVSLINQIADPETRRQVRTVFVDSLRMVWAFCCAMSGVAGLLSPVCGITSWRGGWALLVHFVRIRRLWSCMVVLSRGRIWWRCTPYTAKASHCSLRSIPGSDRGLL